MSNNKGSVFHGWLMQQISLENPMYVDKLHKSELKPFSQYLYYDKKSDHWLWQVNTLNQEAEDNFSKVFENAQTIYLKHNDCKIEMNEIIKKETVSYDELTQKHYLSSEPQRKIRVHFLTTTFFNASKQHLIFPSIFHIYQNLMNRFNTFSTTIKINDPEVLEHLLKHTEITGYRLETQHYYVEKGKIKGFQGSVDLYCSGPGTLINLADLLFDFGNYSGVGVRTALGMGGMNFLSSN